MRKLILLALLLLLQHGVYAQEPYVLKFATLAPEGSPWMKIIDAWAKRVQAESKGRLRFQIYPGGVSGDEQDVLSKVRFGQLHGAAVTGHGIGLMFSAARVLEMPFLFRNYDEIDHVRTALLPEIRAGFRKNGFELVGWMEVGFVRFFSKSPIRSIDDLRKRRLWLWQGDPLGEAFFSVSELSPIPLSIVEVFTSLSTGLIDTVYAPPLAAIAMQWFTKTTYVTDETMADGIGALVVTSQFFKKLPADLQDLLLRTGNEAGNELIQQSRKDNEKSLIVLKDYGLKFVPWERVNENSVIKLRDRAAAVLAKDDYIPANLFERVRKMIEDYRKSTGTRADVSPAD